MNLKKLLIISVLISLMVPAASLAVNRKKAAAIAKPVYFADIVKIGSNINIQQGTTVNSAVAVGGSVAVAGEVLQDAVAVGGSVILKSSAKVTGNVVAIGGMVKKDPGALVAGEITEVIMPQPLSAVTVYGAKLGPSVFYMATVFASLLAFLGILAIGISAGLIFPKRVGWTATAIERHPWKSFFWGILFLILAVPIMLLLIVSVIGIPLILAEVLLYGLALVLGYIGVCQVLGKKLLVAFRRYNMPMVTEIIWGIILLTLIGLVPFLGQLVFAIVCTIGLGACWMTRFGEGI